MADQPETHTRTSTPDGPDFCDECSRAIQDYVKWPCEASQRTDDVMVPLHIEDGRCRTCEDDTDVNDDGLCFACFMKGRHAWLR